MVKTKTINELQVKLLAFIAKINSAARGNNESIQWLSEESNYLFLKTPQPKAPRTNTSI